MDKIKNFFGHLRDEAKTRAAKISNLLPFSSSSPALTADVAAATATTDSSSIPSTKPPSTATGNPMLAGWAPRTDAETADKDKLDEKAKQKQNVALPRGNAICVNCRCMFLAEWNHPVACNHHVGRVMIKNASGLYGVPSLGENVHPRSAFVWSCCGETVGRSAGCKSGPHRAVGERRR